MCVCVYQHSWGQNINGCFTRYILLWHVCQGLTWDYGADGFNGFVTSREANFESGLHIYIYTSYILRLYKFLHMYIICRSTVYQDGTQRWRFGSFSEANSLSC